MLTHLGYENDLRDAVSMPPAKRLWGPRSLCLCTRRRGISIEKAAKDLLRAPHDAWSELGLDGKKRLLLFDEFMAHAKFTAAMDCVALVASDPLLWTGHSKRAGSQDGLQAATFLTLKLAQAAIEGGHFDQARSLLVRSQQMCTGLPRRAATTQLLAANTLMLRGRLLQLLQLPERSAEILSECEEAFKRATARVPAGFVLLRLRTDLQRNPRSVESLFAAADSECDSTESIFGGLARPYLDYIKAREAIKNHKWSLALDRFRAAATSLKQNSHHGIPHAIREAFAILGQGCALVELGRSRERADDVAAGIRLLLQARSQFRREEFRVGEYLAHRHFARARRQQSLGDESAFRLYREAWDLAGQTGVVKFNLEAGLEFATALYNYGRPNRARPLLVTVQRLAEDPEVVELTRGKEWSRIEELLNKTKDSKANCIEPLQRWGVSQYSLREREYVQKVSAANACVCLYGPAGAARQVLIERIARARGQSGAFAILDGVGADTATILSELDSIPVSAPIILKNLDSWNASPDDVFRTLQASRPNDWHVRTYVTLRVPIEHTDRVRGLSSEIRQALYAGQFGVEPLDRRSEDTFLLARGFLTRALTDRGMSDSPDLLFTGEACRYLKRQYATVADLKRAMKSLAHQLMLDRDVIVRNDDSFQISVEVFNRYLTRPAVDNAKRPVVADDERTVLGRDAVMNADEATVRRLAREFRGSLLSLARSNDVPVSTLRLAWANSGRMSAWHAANGRQSQRQSKAKSRATR